MRGKRVVMVKVGLMEGLLGRILVEDHHFGFGLVDFYSAAFSPLLASVNHALKLFYRSCD